MTYPTKYLQGINKKVVEHGTAVLMSEMRGLAEFWSADVAGMRAPLAQAGTLSTSSALVQRQLRLQDSRRLQTCPGRRGCWAFRAVQSLLPYKQTNMEPLWLPKAHSRFG